MDWRRVGDYLGLVEDDESAARPTWKKVVMAAPYGLFGVALVLIVRYVF